MGYEFELDHKKTTILVGVFFALLVLVFVAGWLSGALFGLPVAGVEPVTVAMPDVAPREQPAVVAIKIAPPPAEPAPEPEPRFSVQVGAFQTAGKARSQALGLREKGFTPYVLRGRNSKGGVWFTVRIGDYGDYDEALASARAFEEKEAVVPVITHIDTLSVVRTADGSPPPTAILNSGQRLGIDDLADESADEEAGDASPVEDDLSDGENRNAGSDEGAENAGGDEGDEDAADTENAESDVTVDGDEEKAMTAQEAGPSANESDSVETVEDDDVSEKATAAGETADAAEENPVAGEGTADESAGAAGEEASTVEEAGTDALERTDGNSLAAPDADQAATESDETASELQDHEAKRFSVQVGAFLNARNAHRLADKLREKRYGAYVFDVDDAAGKTWYAVRIDDYGDMKAALVAARKAREDEDLPALVTRIDSLTVVGVPGGGPVGTGPEAAPADRPVYPVSGGTARHPYSLRLASFRSQEAADQAVAVYRRKGLPAFSIRVDVTGGDAFRLVHMGLYDSYALAHAAQVALNLPEAVIKKTPWANLVGVYSQMAEAEAQFARLVEAGFSPYMARQPDESVHVLAGAFSTHERAEAHGQRLIQSSFHSAVVER
ncbi:MAG: SPOR domain-containing protein [Desulfobacterales bacterium]|nr:SPOR domain-containing protein [Desulfobacterales bacterium]